MKHRQSKLPVGPLAARLTVLVGTGLLGYFRTLGLFANGRPGTLGNNAILEMANVLSMQKDAKIERRAGTENTAYQQRVGRARYPL